LENKKFLRRRRRSEKFLSTFLDIFGKFVNKNAVKSGFWGGLGRSISKISKNAHFLEKIIFNYGKNLKYFYQGAKSPTQISPRKGSKYRSHFMEPS